MEVAHSIGYFAGSIFGIFAIFVLAVALVKISIGAIKYVVRKVKQAFGNAKSSSL